MLSLLTDLLVEVSHNDPNSIFNKDAYNLVLSPHSLGVPGAPPYRDPEHAAERSKRSPYAPGSE